MPGKVYKKKKKKQKKKSSHQKKFQADVTRRNERNSKNSPDRDTYPLSKGRISDCYQMVVSRIAKTFARKGSYSNPMVGMVTSEKVHKMDNTTTVVDGCVKNEGLDTLKRRIDLFEAFQNLCNPRRWLYEVYATEYLPKNVSLRLHFDTSIASVLIEIYNNDINFKQSQTASVFFHSELLENLMKHGKFSGYCLKEIEKVKDEVLSKLNEKSTTTNTTYKELRPLAIQLPDRMAIFLSKALCFVRYRTRASLNCNSYNMVKLDDVRFSIDHKAIMPSESDKLINTPIENIKLDVCCKNTNKLQQPRFDNELPIVATRHIKTESVERFLVNYKKMRLPPPDNVTSPALGNKRNLGKLVWINPKAINPFKSNDALLVLKEKLILNKEHRSSLIQSTMTASNKFVVAAKRPVASMEVLRMLFDMEWEKKDRLMKKMLLKSFLDKIQEITINLTQPNSSAIEVQGIPKLTVSSLYLRNRISCNITIKLRGNKSLIFTSVPFTLVNNILQKCSDLLSVAFKKYAYVRQKGAYNGQGRFLAISAEPEVHRLMTSLRIFQVGSTSPFQLENVTFRGSNYKLTLEKPIFPTRMSWILNGHYMCDVSMNGGLTTIVLPNCCLHYGITKFVHIGSHTDIFVNFPEIWAKICEPLPNYFALGRVKKMNSVETNIVSRIKNHHYANCEETWSDQVDNDDIWSDQVYNEIKGQDGFDAGQYEFFTNNTEQNANIESHEKSIIGSHEKSRRAEKVDRNREYNTENKLQQYGLLETPVNLAWRDGNSGSLDDYMSEENEVYGMFDVGQYAFFENANKEYGSIEDEYDFIWSEKVDDNIGKNVVFNAEQYDFFGKSTYVKRNNGREDIKLENLDEDNEATGMFEATQYEFFSGISEVNGYLEDDYEVTAEDKLNENAQFKGDYNTEDYEFFNGTDTWADNGGGTVDATGMFDAGQYTFFDSAGEMNENIESDDVLKWNEEMSGLGLYEFDEEDTRDIQGESKPARALYDADQLDFFQNAEIGDWNILGKASWNEELENNTPTHDNEFFEDNIMEDKRVDSEELGCGNANSDMLRELEFSFDRKTSAEYNNSFKYHPRDDPIKYLHSKNSEFKEFENNVPENLGQITVPFKDMSDIIFDKGRDGENIFLSSGGFGDIFTAHMADSQDMVIVKKIKNMKFADVLREIKIQIYLMPGLYVPQVFGLIGGPGFKETMILQQFCAGGQTLYDTIQACHAETSVLFQTQWLQLSCKLATYLDNMHQKGVLHNDIKSDNILVDFKETDILVYFIDFGQATFRRGRRLEPPPGCLDCSSYDDYLAPEVRCCLPSSPQSDIYSLGKVFFEIAYYFCEDLGPISVEMCEDSPAERLSIKEVIKRIENIINKGDIT